MRYNEIFYSREYKFIELDNLLFYFNKKECDITNLIKINS